MGAGMNERRQTPRKDLDKAILVNVPTLDKGYRFRPLVDLSETGVAFAPRGLTMAEGEQVVLLIPDGEEEGLFFEVSGTVVHSSASKVGVSFDQFSPDAMVAVLSLFDSD